MTANCAYLVVIVMSVTRPDVLLSCEAVMGKHISKVDLYARKMNLVIFMLNHV